MKRVMSEVLPTLCSPRKTSLNLRRGFENSDGVDAGAFDVPVAEAGGVAVAVEASVAMAG